MSDSDKSSKIGEAHRPGETRTGEGMIGDGMRRQKPGPKKPEAHKPGNSRTGEGETGGATGSNTVVKPDD